MGRRLRKTLLLFSLGFSLFSGLGVAQNPGGKTPKKKVVHRKKVKRPAKASYFSDAFHNRKTSSGEAYNKYDFTCAHRHLPFNTLLKITNLKNKKSVIVRVNDRGPFNYTRVVDLSKAAAQSIGMIRDGVAYVKVAPVKPDSNLINITQLFDNDTIYTLRGQLTDLKPISIIIWETTYLDQLVEIAKLFDKNFKGQDVYIRKKPGVNSSAVYELILKVRRQGPNDLELADELVSDLKKMGFYNAHY